MLSRTLVVVVVFATAFVSGQGQSPTQDGAIDYCQNQLGWTVHQATDAIICTKPGVSWSLDCNNCTLWRLVVYKDGGHDPSWNGEPYPTKAGEYYGGHTPCDVGWNLPTCGQWDNGNVTPAPTTPLPAPGVTLTFALDGIPTAPPLLLGGEAFVAFTREEVNNTHHMFAQFDPLTVISTEYTLQEPVFLKPIATVNGPVYYNSRSVAQVNFASDTLNWRVDRKGNTKPCASNATAVFCALGTSPDTTLTGINVKNGVEEFSFSPKTLQLDDIDDIVYHEGTVFFADAGTVVAYSPAKKGVAWTLHNPCGITTGQLVVLETTAGLFALVLFGTTADDTSALCRIEHYGGTVEWSLKFSGYVSGLYAGEGVIFYTDAMNQGLHAVNATTGKQMFQRAIQFRDFGCDPVATEGMLIASFQGQLTAISLTPPYGDVWSLDTHTHCSLPLVADRGRLYRVYYPYHIASHNVADGSIVWQLDGIEAFFAPAIGTLGSHPNQVVVVDSTAQLWSLTRDAAAATPEPTLLPTPAPGPNPTQGPSPTPPPGLNPILRFEFEPLGALQASCAPSVLPTGEILIGYLDEFGDYNLDAADYTSGASRGVVLQNSVDVPPLVTPNGTALYCTATEVGELDPQYGLLWTASRKAPYGGATTVCTTNRELAFVPSYKTVEALSLPGGGQRVWAHETVAGARTPATHEEYLFFMDGSTIVALSQSTGVVAWQVERPCQILDGFLAVVQTDIGLYSLLVYGPTATDKSTGAVCRLHHEKGTVEWQWTYNANIAEVGGGGGYVWATETNAFTLILIDASSGSTMGPLKRATSRDVSCTPRIHSWRECSADGCTTQSSIFYSDDGVFTARKLSGAFDVMYSQEGLDCTDQPSVIISSVLVTSRGRSTTSLDIESGEKEWISYIPAAYAAVRGPQSTAAIVSVFGGVSAFGFKYIPVPTTPAPVHPGPAHTPSDGVSAGAVAAIVLVLVASMAGAFGFYMYKTKGTYRRAPSPDTTGIPGETGATRNVQHIGRYDEIPDV